LATFKKMAKRKQPNRRILEFLAKDVSYRIQRIPPPEVERDKLLISRGLLERTVAGLCERSAGWRESGAIWIGSLNGADSIVQDVIFFHDLCDDKGRSLSLELSEEAKFTLYSNLAKTGQKLIGMIHTHPEDWVDLSGIDKNNQLCSRIGFWSLVLPYYAKQSWEIKTTGIHIRADRGWHQLSEEDAAKRIVIT
jgi:proteasome lid subunit RPN8/RPN11